MAFREVRIYFRLPDEEKQIALSKELWADFTFYMDTVMRGRFREYSGLEVKGINIVNLHLFDSKCLETKDKKIFNKWNAVLNAYEYNAIFDYSKLVGTKRDKVYCLIDTFLQYASESALPQMKTLTKHAVDSRIKIDINDVMSRANAYRQAINKKQC